MPVKPEDRTTINVGADLLHEARVRAGAEGRAFSELVAVALRQYLNGSLRPRENLIPGLVSAEPDLRADVQLLVAELRQLVPAVTAAVQNQTEVLDTLDEISAEIGRRSGAAHALEQAGHRPTRGG
jgi:hypothetical protein